MITSCDRGEKRIIKEGHREMPTDNTGVQTRAMAQRTDSEPQETQNRNVNPTVELHKSKDESIKDFVRKHGTIALDWYVPNFSNTRVGDLIEQRLPIKTADGRLVFSCPTLSEFFRTLNFELDLKTGQVFTYLSPPENIGISCQKDPFYLEFLRNMLREEQDRREFGKNLEHQKTGRTSRHDELGGNRTKNSSVLSLVATVHRHLSRTEEKVRTITGQCSRNMQSIRTLHV